MLLQIFHAELKRLSASAMQVDENTIRFRGGVFRLVHNWNLLVPITTGEITIETGTKELLINYTITFTQLIVFASVMVLLIAAVELAQQEPGGIMFAPIAWVWLVGMNVLLGIPRFRDFMDKCVRQVVRNDDA